MGGASRLKSIRPPWQGFPSAAEYFRYGILIRKLHRCNERRCIQEMGEIAHSRLVGMQDDHARVEQVRRPGTVGRWDGRICQLLKRCLL